jgi:galactose mutarotase-like enzyme
MSDPLRTWVSISSGELTAEIDPHGAQLSALRTSGGADLLWNGDPSIWAGRAPLLFPIVGVLAGGIYRLGSAQYALSRHGFARDKRFLLEDRSAAAASFTLRPDASTLAVYPFQFELQTRFELHGATLSVSTEIRNRGNTAMPASFGYHPGFRWPLPFGPPRASHIVRFESDEPAAVRRIDAGGLLTPTRHPTPIANRQLVLTDALFQDDVLILDRVKSRSVVYGGSEGPQLRIGFPDAEYLGLWTKPGAPFICIEPWHGITDSQGYTGDFVEKPGIFVVMPGGLLTAKMDITLLNG